MHLMVERTLTHSSCLFSQVHIWKVFPLHQRFVLCSSWILFFLLFFLLFLLLCSVQFRSPIIQKALWNQPIGKRTRGETRQTLRQLALRNTEGKDGRSAAKCVRPRSGRGGGGGCAPAFVYMYVLCELLSECVSGRPGVWFPLVFEEG